MEKGRDPKKGTDEGVTKNVSDIGKPRTPVLCGAFLKLLYTFRTSCSVFKKLRNRKRHRATPSSPFLQRKFDLPPRPSKQAPRVCRLHGGAHCTHRKIRSLYPGFVLPICPLFRLFGGDTKESGRQGSPISEARRFRSLMVSKGWARHLRGVAGVTAALIKKRPLDFKAEILRDQLRSRHEKCSTGFIKTLHQAP